MEYYGLGDAAFCPDGVCDVNGVRTGSAGSPGLQVDFLIQTAHANVVAEIKRMKEIGLSVAKEVADKISHPLPVCAGSVRHVCPICCIVRTCWHKMSIGANMAMEITASL